MTNYSQNVHLIELRCAFSVDISPESRVDISEIVSLPYLLSAEYSAALLKKQAL